MSGFFFLYYYCFFSTILYIVFDGFNKSSSQKNSVLDTVVISGEDVCCSVVFGTLVDVISVM